MAIEPMQQFSQAAGLLRTIVYVLDQRPFESDTAAGDLYVFAADLDQILDRIALVDGEHGGAQLILRGVKGNSKTDLALFCGEALDGGNEADGRDRKAPSAHVEAAGIAEAVDGCQVGFVVVERFAHAHEHHIGYALSFVFYFAGEVKDLLDDLAAAQIAAKTHLSGSAEDAAHGATGLGGNAQRVALFVAHEHSLNGLAV